MKKITLICATLLLAALALSHPFRSLMDLTNTPAVTKAEISGQDGALTVTAPNTIVNKYGVLAVDAPVGASFIAVANPGGASGLDLAALRPGDLILIIQMAGASIDASNTASYGLVTNLNSAGRHEFITVSGVESNMIRISPPCGGLRFSYSAAGKTQVIRVPQYTTLTVNSGAGLTAPAWNGQTGGVVAVHVQSSAIINGAVDVSGLGYRGGALSSAGGGGLRTDYVTPQQDFGAEKGESFAGYQVDYDMKGGRYGRGAPANGGGGATSHNSGGGGGANGNNGKTWTGQGVMDGGATGASAWTLDPGYIANGNQLTDSSGGGRGGYSYAVNEANALTQGPGNSVWGGDNRRDVGGLGGRPAPQDTAGRIFFGGGGGAGGQNNDSGGAGGNGGGLIYIISDSVSGAGTLRSNGLNGGGSRNENRDGVGGGGAGGTIVVSAKTLSGVSAQANGGNGANQSPPVPPFTPESEGPGGGGGGGFIAFSAAAGGPISTQVNGGLHGSTQAPSLAEFPANGATRGATGATSAAIGSIPFCSTNSDIAVTKTNNSTAIVPGAPTTYTIVVRNNGPNAVFGIPVTDNLPAVFTNAAWTCAASAGSSCQAASGAGNINTTVNLLNGGTATFQLTATPNPAATGQVTNTATIAPPDGAVDTNPSNNTASHTGPLTPQADLSITKTDGAASVTAGTALTYTIVVRNNGPSTVNGATVTDTIPPQLAGASWTCAASSGGSCAQAAGNGNINTTVNLGPGAQATFSLTATVLATATGSFTNTATVTSPAAVPDTAPNNNSASDTDTIGVSADLAITKSNNGNTVTAGGSVTYTVVVTNNGPSAVVGAPVTDNLPAQLTNATWTCSPAPPSSANQCQQGAGVGNVNTTVSLAPAATATFAITATVRSDGAGSVTNTATVAAPPGATDPNSNNNTATDADSIARSANLGITKTANPTNVPPGATVTYTIEVTNGGPSDVTGASVNDLLPAPLNNASWTCVATPGSSCGAPSGPGSIVTTVSLIVGGKATFTLTATVASDFSGATLANTAIVTPPAGTTDPTNGNNSSTSTINITPSSDLSLTKTASPNPVRATQEVTFTINVTNHGPSTATGVTVTDPLPPGLTLTSATASGGSCSGTDTIICVINSIGANNTATVTIRATVGAQVPIGPLSNTAVVSSNVTDPNNNNNTGTATVTVAGPPAARIRPSDIAIRTTGTDACIGPGNVLNVEVKLTNSGDGPQNDNPGPEFTALLPIQLTGMIGSCSVPNGTCQVGVTQVNWNGQINPGQTVTITYRVRVRDSIQPGSRFCTDFRANFDTNNDGLNDAAMTATQCQEADCQPPCSGSDCPDIGPGLPLPDNPSLTGSDQRPGSILIFPFYISDPAGDTRENTRISITNTDPARPAYLHMFFVDGSSCSVADNFLCLTPNQTASFLISDVDPGVAGYLIAVAVDGDGCPTNFNYLIGDQYVKLSSGHAANLGAEAVAAIKTSKCSTDETTAAIRLDGNEYSLLGRVLAADNIPSMVDGASTLLVVNRIGGDLTAEAAAIGPLFGLLYDDAENAFSFGLNVRSCQLRIFLNQSFPRTTPRFPDVIPAGRSGWMKFWINTTGDEAALTGATINANPNPGGFRGGHNLHKLTLGSATLTMPLLPPSCQ